MASHRRFVHRLIMQKNSVVLATLLLALSCVVVLHLIPRDSFLGETCQNILRPRSERLSAARTDYMYTATFMERRNYRLYLRLKTSLAWGETRSYLLQSLQPFWPDASLLVVLDQDDPNEVNFAKHIAEATKQYLPVHIEGVTVPPYNFDPSLTFSQNKVNKGGYRWGGYYRGQLDMLYADEVVNSTCGIRRQRHGLFHFSHSRSTFLRQKVSASGQTKDFSFILEKNKFPLMRVSFHVSYSLDFLGKSKRGFLSRQLHLGNSYRPGVIGLPLVYGFCFVAMELCKSQTKCGKIQQGCHRIGFRENRVFLPLYKFEGSSVHWEWEPNTCKVQNTYLQSLSGREIWLDYAVRLLRRIHPELWKQMFP